LAGDILKDVSRSFYLTLRLLPQRVRGGICLGYLLARTSDTIADTEVVPVEQRLSFLQRFREVVESGEGSLARSLQGDLEQEFQRFQSDPGEKRLLEHTADAIAWLRAVPAFERESVHAVLREILRGQSLDCQRFGERGELRFLPDRESLEEYTYLVAGSVGEFWTRLCFHHWERFSREGEAQMMAWARSYGRALQLINVLRDMPRDLENGRGYLPQGEVAFSGNAPEAKGLLEACHPWEKRCRDQLEEALRYCQSVRPIRLRYATVLPLLLAERTLAYLSPASWPERQEGIKVSRAEVKAIMKRALVVNCTPKRLSHYIEELRRV
jgi:farnesyl-diphosphate farnesyltransferase